MSTPTATRTPQPATSRQQALLRKLAVQTGTSFTPPKSKVAAMREIDRLTKLQPDSRADQRREKLEISKALQTEAGGAARVHEDEVTGYGSTAAYATEDVPGEEIAFRPAQPTAKQRAFIRKLAAERGLPVTFVQSRGEAGREINRLLAMPKVH